MDSFQDHYAVLEVSRDASPDDVKTAFRALALAWHPDKNPDDVAAATLKFQQVQAAYEVLGDPDKRKAYNITYDKHAEKEAQREAKKAKRPAPSGRRSAPAPPAAPPAAAEPAFEFYQQYPSITKQSRFAVFSRGRFDPSILSTPGTAQVPVNLNMRKPTNEEYDQYASSVPGARPAPTRRPCGTRPPTQAPHARQQAPPSKPQAGISLPPDRPWIERLAREARASGGNANPSTIVGVVAPGDIFQVVHSSRDALRLALDPSRGPVNPLRAEEFARQASFDDARRESAARQKAAAAARREAEFVSRQAQEDASRRRAAAAEEEAAQRAEQWRQRQEMIAEIVRRDQQRLAAHTSRDQNGFAAYVEEAEDEEFAGAAQGFDTGAQDLDAGEYEPVSYDNTQPTQNQTAPEAMPEVDRLRQENHDLRQENHALRRQVEALQAAEHARNEADAARKERHKRKRDARLSGNGNRDETGEKRSRFNGY